jgi:hypothetical protein
MMRRRYAMPERELTVTAELMMLTVSQISRWLVHSKPPQVDAEAFIVAVGRILQALLPARAARQRNQRSRGR